MSIIYPFVGLLPQHDLAKDICSPPYDVMNKAEAKEMVSKKNVSVIACGSNISSARYQKLVQ